MSEKEDIVAAAEIATQKWKIRIRMRNKKLISETDNFVALTLLCYRTHRFLC